MTWYIDLLPHEKLAADTAGITGSNWPQTLLKDLLWNDDFHAIFKEHPKRDCYTLFGRKTNLIVREDDRFADTLFVITVQKGPELGGTPKPPQARVIKGPWKVAESPYRRQTPVQGKILEVLQKVFAQEMKPKGSATPVAKALPPTPSPGLGSMGDILKAKLPVNLPNTPVMPKVEPTVASAQATIKPPQAAEPLPQIAPPPEPPRPPLEVTLPPPDGWHALLLAWFTQNQPVLAPYLDAPERLKSQRQELEVEISHIQNKLQALQQKYQALPDLTQLEDVRKKLNEMEIAAIGLPLPGVLAATSNQDVLLQMFKAMQRPAWRVLPPWLLADDPVSPQGQQRILADRTLIQQFLGHIDVLEGRFGTHPPEAIRQLADVPGRSPEGRLALALKSLEQVAARQQILGELLHKDLLVDLQSKVGEWGIEKWLQQTEPARLARVPETIRKAMVRWDAFEAVIQMFDGHLPEIKPPTVQSMAAPIQLQHVLSDKSLTASKVYIAATKGSEPIQFYLPFRLRSTQQLQGPYEISAQAEHLENFPERELGQGFRIQGPPSKRQVVGKEIHLPPWYRSEDKEDLEFVVPMVVWPSQAKKWLEGKEHLRVKLSVGWPGGQIEGNLNFNEFYADWPASLAPLRDRTESAEMLKCPLGVEELYEKLERQIKDGHKSFYVVAPRRFGKSTLRGYLVEKAKNMGYVFDICLNRNSAPQKNIEQVFKEIQIACKKDFQLSPEIDVNTIWRAETFDGIRRLLRQHQYTCAYLFIDEAQALFPHRDGGIWGTALKNLIENSLSKESSELARLNVILFGTPALVRQMGNNCQTFMNVGAARYRFDEDSLTYYLRQQTQDRLQSSKVARELLAKSTCNIRTLWSLLDELMSLLREQGRPFFLAQDVEVARQRLISKDQQDPSHPIWDYERSELSHVDEWEPVDAYPVALAWALEGTVARATHWLNIQLRQIQEGVMITQERVKQALEELQRTNMMDENLKFIRPLLHELLRLQAQGQPFRADVDQVVLARLAVDALIWPEQARPVTDGKGAQAEVFVVQEEQKSFAWRRCAINTSADRARFMRTCVALRALRDQSGHPRALPRIRQVGFDINDPDNGIMVYDWVNGDKLQELNLSEFARAKVVCDVAYALLTLKNRNIVHRDVHPRNILVDTKLNAVLIDFGLACLAQQSTQTTLGDPRYLAPELTTGQSASWASDIYALGAVLSEKGLKNERLRNLSEKMCNPSPEQRLSPQQVIEILEDYISENKWTQEEKSVDDVLVDSMDAEWLYKLLNEYRERAVLRRANQLSWSELGALEAADLLNHIFEAWLQNGEGKEVQQLRGLNWPPKSTALAALAPSLERSQNPPELQHWRQPAIEAVGLMRIAYAHRIEKLHKLSEAAKKMGKPASLDTWNQALNGAANFLSSRIKQESILKFLRLLMP